MHCKFTVVLQCTHCKNLHEFYIALHCKFTVGVSLFSALPLYKPRQVLQWFYSGHCINHCKIYSGFTVSIQWVEALNIVNLQWFYSAVDVERRIFYSGSGIRSSRHCIILRCTHCKYTVWPL